MARGLHTLRIVKRILFLSGLLTEESSEIYPKKNREMGAKAEGLISSKKLYLNPDLTINMLAREIGTNRTYLSKFFSEEKGCKFRDYINRLRVQNARLLLMSSERYMIADIAILSGFGSVRALNRAFVKNYGKLPSKLRKEAFRAS